MCRPLPLAVLRRYKAERDDETASLRSKINRMTAVQKEAMDSGPNRAHQLLYWDSLKGTEPSPTKTWRGTEEPLPPAMTPAMRSVSPTRRLDERGEPVGRGGSPTMGAAGPSQPAQSAESPS